MRARSGANTFGKEHVSQCSGRFVSCVGKSLPYRAVKLRARPGFEPGTSRTRSENHTPRPTSHSEGFLLEEKSPVNHRDREKWRAPFLSHWCSGASSAAPLPILVLSCKHRSAADLSCSTRARPGFEPGTSRTQSENHTPRPTSHRKKTTSQVAISNRSTRTYADSNAKSCALGN